MILYARLSWLAFVATSVTRKSCAIVSGVAFTQRIAAAGSGVTSFDVASSEHAVAAIATTESAIRRLIVIV